MREMMKLAAITVFGFNASVAFGQSLIDAENLLFSPPKDFKIGFQSNRDNRLMTEWGKFCGPIAKASGNVTTLAAARA